MLFLLVSRRFGVKRNDRQQLFSIGEHFFLNHRAQLLVTGPVWITAAIVGSGAQDKVYYLITEIFRVTDTRWFFNFFQFGVQRLAIEQLTGIRVAILLILNPEIRISHVTIKNVLPVLRVRFEIGRLDLLADKFGVFRDQVAFQELQITLSLLLRELLALDLLFQNVEQMYRVCRHFRMVEVEYAGEDLKGESGGERPFIPSSTPA